MSCALGIDTSSSELGIGLARNGVAVASFSSYVGNSHAEHIAQAVDFLLRSYATNPCDIDRIGIAVGPGSFTGLRISIAFVKGFCLDRAVKILPVSSLTSLAVAVPSSGSLVAAFDARKNGVAWNRFTRSDRGLMPRGEDRLDAAEAFERALLSGDTVVTDMLGNARGSAFSFLESRGSWLRAESLFLQRGVGCALLASSEPEDSAAWVNAAALSPRYLSPTYVDAPTPT